MAPTLATPSTAGSRARKGRRTPRQRRWSNALGQDEHDSLDRSISPVILSILSRVGDSDRPFPRGGVAHMVRCVRPLNEEEDTVTWNRRHFLRGSLLAVANVAILSACGGQAPAAPTGAPAK